MSHTPDLYRIRLFKMRGEIANGERTFGVLVRYGVEGSEQSDRAPLTLLFEAMLAAGTGGWSAFPTGDIRMSPDSFDSMHELVPAHGNRPSPYPDVRMTSIAQLEEWMPRIPQDQLAFA